jgi:hypothetical protein
VSTSCREPFMAEPSSWAIEIWISIQFPMHQKPHSLNDIATIVVFTGQGLMKYFPAHEV